MIKFYYIININNKILLRIADINIKSIFSKDSNIIDYNKDKKGFDKGAIKDFLEDNKIIEDFSNFDIETLTDIIFRTLFKINLIIVFF